MTTASKNYYQIIFSEVNSSNEDYSIKKLLLDNLSILITAAKILPKKYCTGPASLALLALKVLLNTTQKPKCFKEVSHLTKSVGHTQSTLAGHPMLILLKDLKKLSIS